MKIFSAKAPWYAAGLAFECIHCGQCCAGPEEGYVWVTQEEIAQIAEHLSVPVSQVHRECVRKVRRGYSLVERADSKDCIFLKHSPEGDNNCMIYPVRPRQCRTWPFWNANLSNPDAWAQAATRCGGINRGKLHSCDEIEANRNATRG